MLCNRLRRAALSLPCATYAYAAPMRGSSCHLAVRIDGSHRPWPRSRPLARETAAGL